MKTIKILSLIMALFIGVSASAQTKQKDVAEVKIKTSAQCEECKENIEKGLSYTKGVISSDLDLKTKEVTVKYKPSKTSVDKIRTAISLTGYDADEVKADKKAYNELSPCCKKH